MIELFEMTYMWSQEEWFYTPLTCTNMANKDQQEAGASLRNENTFWKSYDETVMNRIYSLLKAQSLPFKDNRTDTEHPEHPRPPLELAAQ